MAFLTARQEKWFAALRDGLERETGRSLAEWTEIALACPETAHRKRLAWMKAEYGLGQNRAAIALHAAFPPEATWSRPEILAATLWADSAARAVHEAVRQHVVRLPDIVIGQRKGFTAYSRHFQFCALRPMRHGAMLGLALAPESHALLRPPGRHGWSERLSSSLPIASAESVDGTIVAFLQAAWERS